MSLTRKKEPTFGQRGLPRGLKVELWMLYTTSGELRRNAYDFGNMVDYVGGWRITLSDHGYQAESDDGETSRHFSVKKDVYRWCIDNQIREASDG